jgi:hypothetical protein
LDGKTGQKYQNRKAKTLSSTPCNVYGFQDMSKWKVKKYQSKAKRELKELHANHCKSKKVETVATNKSCSQHHPSNLPAMEHLTIV